MTSKLHEAAVELDASFGELMGVIFVGGKASSPAQRKKIEDRYNKARMNLHKELFSRRVVRSK